MGSEFPPHPGGHLTMFGDTFGCCHWHIAGGVQGHCETSHSTPDDLSPPKRDRLAPTISSAEVEDSIRRDHGGPSGIFLYSVRKPLARLTQNVGRT